MAIQSSYLSQPRSREIPRQVQDASVRFVLIAFAALVTFASAALASAAASPDLPPHPDVQGFV